MTDGTKLDSTSLENKNIENIEDKDELKGTKFGEMSDFEKEFLDTDQKSDKKENNEINENKQSAQTQVESPTEETDDIQQSELERFLNEESSKSFDYEIGDIITGTIRTVEKSGVLIDFNFKSDGYMSNSELGINEEGKTEQLEPGQELLFFIEKLETKEGYAILSRRKAQLEELWGRLIGYSKERQTISVDVVSKVQGGLVASYSSIKGFIPASQIIRENKDGMDQYVGSTMEVAVLQVDPRRKKVIFSNKAAKFNARREGGKILSELEVGQVRDGKVTSIKDFGVFVDLGGVEGLIHISELSWSRVSHPSDFVTLGEDIKVFILGVDKENKRISLGMKQLEPDPWVEVSQKYKIGDYVEGEITRVAAFGAFVKLGEKLEGLIHISELSKNHVEKVSDIVKQGDKINAKIIKLQVEEQKIGLSLKESDDDGNETPAEAQNTTTQDAETTVETQVQEENVQTIEQKDVAHEAVQEVVEETVELDDSKQDSESEDK